MSTEPFIGEVKLFGFDFAPRGYLTCSGQLLSISTNTALFSLLGTTYGGNGQQTFGLPDLRGRMAIGQGQSPGLPAFSMGQIGGMPTATILSANMPPHVHTLNAARVQLKGSTANAGEQSPDGNYPATTSANAYADSPTSNTFLGAPAVTGTTDITGGGQPINIMNPYLCMNYSIAIYGIFPSRQ